MGYLFQAKCWVSTILDINYGLLWLKKLSKALEKVKRPYSAFNYENKGK